MGISVPAVIVAGALSSTFEFAGTGPPTISTRACTSFGPATRKVVAKMTRPSVRLTRAIICAPPTGVLRSALNIFTVQAPLEVVAIGVMVP
ncbi:MAG: hypothetical protein BWY76_01866 [bacterium ADurb.Bin429]|nr:MAG: hypothetical protein BWY76_01866 [bacterium ADurb.Bin429]